ncbi:MAG: hypothetical protein C4308_05815 [Chitinophagaceae bacterium]
MKRWLFMLFLSAVVLNAGAQNFFTEVDFTGGLAIYPYSHDSLVALRKQGDVGMGSDLLINLRLSKQFKPQWYLIAELGYAHREILMNKNSIGDFFISLWMFDAPAPKTFKINQVRLTSHYLNIGSGIHVSLNPNKAFQVHPALQLNAGFLLSSHASLQLDVANNPPSADEREKLKKQYKNSSAKFILGVEPRFDLKFRIHKSLRLTADVFPFMFYVSSWNKKMLSGNTVVIKT